jgi:hypothetical protein
MNQNIKSKISAIRLLLDQIEREIGNKDLKLQIDRTKPFDPVEFIGKGWTIDEQDKRSLDLNEIDLNKVSLETILKEGESIVNGEEKLKRLKESGKIRLDAFVFKTLWDNKELIPEEWEGKYVSFDGTILRYSSGIRCVLYLYWSDGEWDWSYGWLDDDWSVRYPSAVFASICPLD